jgi:hypothetical protein
MGLDGAGTSAPSAGDSNCSLRHVAPIPPVPDRSVWVYQLFRYGSQHFP